jgi:hypothetical protein
MRIVWLTAVMLARPFTYGIEACNSQRYVILAEKVYDVKV